MMMSNAGGSGEQERPTVTARARTCAEAALAAVFPPTGAAIARAQARRAAYDQARAAYEEARKTYAHARAYDHARMYAHFRAYVSLAVKVSGLLPVLLSTVILLGGYVQSLGKTDFFCIMAITVIQAAGIFHDWETNVQYLDDFGETYFVMVLKPVVMMISRLRVMIVIIVMMTMMTIFIMTYLFALVVAIMAPIVFVHLLYLLGPLACAAISLWRMVKLNHGIVAMMAAMNIFYSLIILQGAMFFILLVCKGFYEAIMVSHLRSLEQLWYKWGKEAINMYLSHICTKCRKDPLSIKGMDLIKYAAELLDSESQEDYLYGARLLSAFIKKGKDVSWVLLCSRQRIQKLVDSLWISSSGLDENTEVTELAATIVAGLAGHIDVAMYPGAMRYISSLLQETYWNSSKQACHPQQPQRDPRPFEILFQSKVEKMKHLSIIEEKRQWRLMRDQKRLGTSQERRRQNSEGRNTTSNELILQVLTILERLASNNDNCKLICSTPGLLPKITAPLYSETLTQDVKTKAWADIVTRCLKVLYQLIRNPGWTSRRLRHDICSNDQALSNLKSILLEVGNNEAGHQELQLVAMKILTELALDLSINLTEETKTVLVTKQLQLFLLANGDDEKESAAIAGRAMVSLSANSESNSVFIMTTENDIIGRLTEILDDENITRRTIAAEIMANLCAHCNVDNTMKDILLPKALREIMSIKIKSQERIISAGQNNSASGDEENQGNSVSTNNEEHSISRLFRLLKSRLASLRQQSPTGTEEISDQEREEQEAFLSLAQVICDKVNSADLDGAIQNAIDQNNAGSEEQRREAFVDKLKTVIDDNCHPAADSLRIVKLCGQIAKSVMRCEQYVEIFRNKGFKSSLSEASKTMSELESCMLFVGTDFGLKKTVRPLFSEIEKTWSEI